MGEKSELIRQELIDVLISRKKERFLVHVSDISQRAERSRKESRKKKNSCSQNTNGKWKLCNNFSMLVNPWMKVKREQNIYTKGLSYSWNQIRTLFGTVKLSANWFSGPKADEKKGHELNKISHKKAEK